MVWTWASVQRKEENKYRNTLKAITTTTKIIERNKEKKFMIELVDRIIYGDVSG